MRSLKPRYFILLVDRWCSLSYNEHTFRYKNRTCSFDGYRIKDQNNNILFRYDSHNQIKINDKFKLLSIISDSGFDNYLGINVKTKELITFREHQIQFIDEK